MERAILRIKLALLLIIALTVMLIIQSVEAEKEPIPQGMGPTAIAVTEDGEYAYIGFHLSDNIFKVRLEDLTVESVADLSTYFPIQCYNIALDISGEKLFVHSASWRKLLVLDTETMSLIHTIDNIGAWGIIRSQHGPFFIAWEGGNIVKLVSTETYEVTTWFWLFLSFSFCYTSVRHSVDLKTKNGWALYL